MIRFKLKITSRQIVKKKNIIFIFWAHIKDLYRGKAKFSLQVLMECILLFDINLECQIAALILNNSLFCHSTGEDLLTTEESSKAKQRKENRATVFSAVKFLDY